MRIHCDTLLSVTTAAATIERQKTAWKKFSEIEYYKQKNGRYQNLASLTIICIKKIEIFASRLVERKIE